MTIYSSPVAPAPRPSQDSKVDAAPDSSSGVAGGGPEGRASRRQLLSWGVGLGVGVVGAGVAAVELVRRGVLPGHQVLLDLEGACTLSRPLLASSGSGPTVSGRFFSRARNREVGYSVGYPPGDR